MQLRWCGMPSIVTRHSKQMPMPQSGPRGSPETDLLKAVEPSTRIADATFVPSSTVIS